MDWVWKQFEALSNEQVYDILAARQKVFVLEQKCLYLDVDGRDRQALHLSDCANSKIVAYARLLPPNTQYAEPSIGRVLVLKPARGQGLGRELIQRCLEKCKQTYPAQPIKVSAQVYLQAFYQSFGFEAVGEPYDDGGISHISMALTNTSATAAPVSP